MNSNHYIAIMAGGVGSRFWPSSTQVRPKQFLDILGVGKSLLRMTFERCTKLVASENVLIVTNERYRSLVQEQLPELPNENILGEPSMNNTAPCIAWTALHLQVRNPQAIFAVLPSDHVILKEQDYINRLTEAFTYAEHNDAIVTLGIQPTRPDTGYGYIETEDDGEAIRSVKSFREKPDHETAKSYLDQGNYLWNAGMFVWSVKTIVQAFRAHEPEILQVLTEDLDKLGGSQEQEYINRVYPNTKRISVDYAILERADNVYTIPSDIGWSDLGTWNSLHAFREKDDNDCVAIGKNIHLIESEDIIVRADDNKTVVIKGLQDYIVVDEKDALLIYPKSQEQEIKQVVQSLKGKVKSTRF